MDNLIQFNRHTWVGVIPSTLTDNRYSTEVPRVLYFHDTQVDAVRRALRRGSNFLMSVSCAMGDGWSRPSAYFSGADETGTWSVDVIPIGNEFGDTHIGRVGRNYLVLFLELEVDENHEIIGVIPPKGFP
jgi:hypothetical protein